MEQKFSIHNSKRRKVRMTYAIPLTSVVYNMMTTFALLLYMHVSKEKVFNPIILEELRNA